MGRIILTGKQELIGLLGVVFILSLFVWGAIFLVTHTIIDGRRYELEALKLGYTSCIIPKTNKVGWCKNAN